MNAQFLENYNLYNSLDPTNIPLKTVRSADGHKTYAALLLYSYPKR